MKTLIALITLTCAAFAFADEAKVEAKPHTRRSMTPPFAERMRDRGSMLNDQVAMAVTNPKMAEKLAVTEEQKNKIRALTEEGRGAMKALNDKSRQAMKRQFELMNAEKVDEAEVMAAIDAVFEIRKEIAKSQFKRTLAIRSVLTPEQYAKVGEVVRQFRAERKNRAVGPKAAPKPAEQVPPNDAPAKK